MLRIFGLLASQVLIKLLETHQNYLTRRLICRKRIIVDFLPDY